MNEELELLIEELTLKEVGEIITKDISKRSQDAYKHEMINRGVA